MKKRKAHFELVSKDFRAGTYDLTDVSADPTWSDVKCVESHRDTKGTLTSVVNHRAKDFDAACASLRQIGARGGLVTVI